MTKVRITFDYTNEYGWETRENIIASVETNSNGEIERKTILEKIKSYGFAKTRVSELEVKIYNTYIDFGKVKLV